MNTAEPNMSRCLITSASNKFFPNLINLLGSMAVNYPDHPDVYVYDLGLAPSFVRELSGISWVHIRTIPHFAPHWRKCYTWKTYILNTPIKQLNLYLDAGCEVERPLDDLFEKIRAQDYLLVGQGHEATMSDVTPRDFFTTYTLPHTIDSYEVVTAGIFGFKRESSISHVTQQLFHVAKEGDCLGYSKNEAWKDRGLNRTGIVRDCRLFRHDTTLLSMFIYRDIPNPLIESVDLFSPVKRHGQYIWNLRLTYGLLPYTARHILQSTSKISVVLNRVYLTFFIILKRIINALQRTSSNSTDVLSAYFGQVVMDAWHEYPSPQSSIRYYHRLKASCVYSFLRRHTKRTDRFLDAGAGRGPYSYIAADFVDSVSCYEFDARELAYAEANLANKTNVICRRVDLRSIPDTDASFDIAISSEVLEHIPHEERAMAELYRVLKPGGRLLFSMPNAISLFYFAVRLRHFKKIHQTHVENSEGWQFSRHTQFPFWKIEDLARSAGFRIVARRGVNIIPLGEHMFQRLMRHPRLFTWYIFLEQTLEHVVPFFGSFYFIELTR